MILANVEFGDVVVGLKQLGEVGTGFVADVVIAEVEELDLVAHDIAHESLDEEVHGLVVDSAVAQVDLLFLRHLNEEVLED